VGWWVLGGGCWVEGWCVLRVACLYGMVFWGGGGLRGGLG